MPAMQPASAAVDPTERSKPPPTMTNVMPMAITAMIDDCTRMLVRLSGERNRSVSSAVTAHSTISEISGMWPARLKRWVIKVSPGAEAYVPPSSRGARMQLHARVSKDGAATSRAAMLRDASPRERGDAPQHEVLRLRDPYVLSS